MMHERSHAEATSTGGSEPCWAPPEGRRSVPIPRCTQAPLSDGSVIQVLTSSSRWFSHARMEDGAWHMGRAPKALAAVTLNS